MNNHKIDFYNLNMSSERSSDRENEEEMNQAMDVYSNQPQTNEKFNFGFNGKKAERKVDKSYLRAYANDRSTE